MFVIKELHLLGVSFRTAPAAVREALSFTEAETHTLLRTAKTHMPAREAVVVSTCNRTEFYLAAPHGSGAVEEWLKHLRHIRPYAPILREECHLYQLQGQAAVNHLFRVTCGLDSAVLGDAQILGQVKESLRMASSCGSLGKYLQRAFDLALEAGRRARRESTISSGAAGIGSTLASLVVGRLTPSAETPPTLLMIGAGETARSIARHLAKRGSWRLLFVNRTEAKARDLANQYCGSARPWSMLETSLAEADIVITATASPQPFLSRSVLESVLQHRDRRPWLVVDAGLPRNVEPGAAVELIDIDAIREHQEKTLALRQAAVPVVERIIDEQARAWTRWQATLPVEGTIKQLYEDAAHHRRDMARQLASSSMMPLEEAERMVWHSLRQVLHRHVRNLRGLPERQTFDLAS